MGAVRLESLSRGQPPDSADSRCTRDPSSDRCSVDHLSRADVVSRRIGRRNRRGGSASTLRGSTARQGLSKPGSQEHVPVGDHEKCRALSQITAGTSYRSRAVATRPSLLSNDASVTLRACRTAASRSTPQGDRGGSAGYTRPDTCSTSARCSSGADDSRSSVGDELLPCCGVRTAGVLHPIRPETGLSVSSTWRIRVDLRHVAP